MFKQKEAIKAWEKWFVYKACAGTSGPLCQANNPPEEVISWFRVYTSLAWLAALEYAEEKFTSANTQSTKRKKLVRVKKQ